MGRGEGAVPEGMGHVSDEDGGGGEGLLQDDGHHPAKLHACLALISVSVNGGAVVVAMHLTLLGSCRDDDECVDACLPEFLSIDYSLVV